MNAFIAAAAGGALGVVTMLGTVNAVQSTSSAVAPEDLYTYADE